MGAIRSKSSHLTSPHLTCPFVTTQLVCPSQLHNIYRGPPPRALSFHLIAQYHIETQATCRLGGRVSCREAPVREQLGTAFSLLLPGHTLAAASQGRAWTTSESAGPAHAPLLSIVTSTSTHHHTSSPIFHDFTHLAQTEEVADIYSSAS